MVLLLLSSFYFPFSSFFFLVFLDSVPEITAVPWSNDPSHPDYGVWPAEEYTGVAGPTPIIYLMFVGT